MLLSWYKPSKRMVNGWSKTKEQTMSEKNQTLEILSRLEKGVISPSQAEALLSSNLDNIPSLTLEIQGREDDLRKVLEKLNEVFSEVKLA
jgi:hypothetical protein